MTLVKPPTLLKNNAAIFINEHYYWDSYEAKNLTLTSQAATWSAVEVLKYSVYQNKITTLEASGLTASKQTKHTAQSRRITSRISSMDVIFQCMIMDKDREMRTFTRVERCAALAPS